MKGTTTIFIVTVVYLTLLAGCSTDTSRTTHGHSHLHDPALEARYNAEEEASAKYLVENFPTREETLKVRECITARTGFDEFPEMPTDYGPHILTPTPGEPLIEMPPNVDRAEFDCIFDLGLEDRYIPPWDQHEVIRNANDS